jgi:hypothetical protein
MSKFLPDDISNIEQFLRERAQGHAANPDIAVYGKPAAWVAIADLITKLRAERDAAVRDMRERCAKVAETGFVSANGCSVDHRPRSVAAAIRALPDTPAVIATDGGTKA